MKKFNDGEIFVSTLKVYPKVKFFGYNGVVYYNKTAETSVKLNEFLVSPLIPEGAILLETEETLMTEDDDYIVIE